MIRTIREGLAWTVLIASFTVAGIVAADENAKSITGCLNKAPQPGYFVITDEKTGEKTTVRGPEELARHAANHRVKVTGNTTTVAGDAIFDAVRVEHLSDTCTAAK